MAGCHAILGLFTAFIRRCPVMRGGWLSIPYYPKITILYHIMIVGNYSHISIHQPLIINIKVPESPFLRRYCPAHCCSGLGWRWRYGSHHTKGQAEPASGEICQQTKHVLLCLMLNHQLLSWSHWGVASWQLELPTFWWRCQVSYLFHSNWLMSIDWFYVHPPWSFPHGSLWRPLGGRRHVESSSLKLIMSRQNRSKFDGWDYSYDI